MHIYNMHMDMYVVYSITMWYITSAMYTMWFLLCISHAPNICTSIADGSCYLTRKHTFNDEACVSAHQPQTYNILFSCMISELHCQKVILISSVGIPTVVGHRVLGLSVCVFVCIGCCQQACATMNVSPMAH